MTARSDLAALLLLEAPPELQPSDALRALGNNVVHRDGLLLVEGAPFPRTRKSRPARQRAAGLLLTHLPELASRFAHVEELVLDGSLSRDRYPRRDVLHLRILDALPTLRRLELRHLHGLHDDLPLARHPTLRELVFSGEHHGGRAFVGNPNLRSIRFERAWSIRIEGLPRCAALRELHAPGAGVDAPLDHPELEVASGLQFGALQDLSAFGRLPALRHLAIHARRLPSVEGLGAHPKLEHLDLRTTSVRDLTPLGRLPALRTCVITGDVEHLWPADAAPPQLRSFEADRSLLTHVDGLAGCTELELVRLRHARVVDVGGLANHPRLKTLDLRGARDLKDLQPLGEPPCLERLELGATKVTRTRVPEALHPLVRPPSLVKKRSRRKSRAPKPEVLRGRRGRQVARTRKLLLTRSFEKIDHAIEILAGLGDPEVFGGLLDGVSYEPAARPAGRLDRIEAKRYGSFRPNQVFEHARVVAPWRTHALRGLLAVAPTGSDAAKVRDAVSTLLVSGVGARRQKFPVDLGPLAHYPALVALAVRRSTHVRGLDAISRMRRLEQLQLHDVRPQDAPPLALPETLRRVSVRNAGTWDPVGRGSTWGAVRELVCDNVRLRDASFAHLGSARAIRLTRCQIHDASSFEDLELRSLDLAWNPLDSLAPLGGITSLHELELAGTRVRDLRPLERLHELRTLGLDHFRGDLAPLRSLPHLTTLSLRHAREVDLGVLAGHAGLKTILVSRGAVPAGAQHFEGSLSFSY